MLGRYLRINNVEMPNPTTFEYQYNPSENIYESEAGTQLSNIRRLDRLSFTASFNCSSRLKDTLEGICKSASASVSIDGGEALSGRIRLGGAITLVEGSENVGGTQGLWSVPIIFEGE